MNTNKIIALGITTAAEHIISELKEAEKAYQITYSWNFNEELTEEEYKNGVGKYYNYSLREIAEEICTLIKEL